jgi:ubiquinone/menaquinone biosynthesis C-methylase UbiE
MKYDSVAADYDRTRGGEPRGERYATYLAPWLRQLSAANVEIGVGTGLVSLGLRRLGFDIAGLDLSEGMLTHAKARLGTGLVRADATRLPFADDSVGNIVSVWMIQATAEPLQLIREAYRVLCPGGRFLVCPMTRPAFRDLTGVLIAQMHVRLESRTPGISLPPVVSADVVVEWAKEVGFSGRAERLPDEKWESTAEDEIENIEQRRWAPLVDLDEATFAEVTAPTLTALRDLPEGPVRRRSVAELAILEKPER